MKAVLSSAREQKTVFVVRDREAGNIIDTFATREKAEEAIAMYEDEDRQDDCYTPDFYEVYEMEEDMLNGIYEKNSYEVYDNVTEEIVYNEYI